MSDAFHLSMPWWAFCVRGAVVYLVLLIYLRITDRRSIGEMSAFDVVVLIVIGGTVRNAIVGLDASLPGPLIAVATMLAIDKAIGWFCARSPRLSRLMEGRSSILVRNGQRDMDALKRHDISVSAFEREVRLAGMEDESSVKSARLEANGRISWIRNWPSPHNRHR
jgi:uncharacterized membrane protein YcaP (DUF421 family)